MTINDKKVAVLFPGQGSQFVGMGKEFLESDPEAAALMELAESMSGFSISKLCLDGPEEELTRAVHLQPALTVTNLICWQALKREGIKPDFFAGHSLGEFSALCAADVLSPRDTFSLVTRRGTLMEREGRKNPGGMLAIVGLGLNEVQEVLDGLSGAVTAANHNSEKQIVISGESGELKKVATVFAQKGARAIPIKVSVANHSPLVRDAVPDFEKAMAAIDFHSPSVPVFFNVTAAPEDEPEKIRKIMARQIASRVRWFEIMNKMVAENVRIFIEVGPKKVLTGLLKKSLPKGYEYQRFQVDTPEAVVRFLDEVKVDSH